MTGKYDLVKPLLLSPLANEDDLASLVPNALDPRSEVVLLLGKFGENRVDVPVRSSGDSEPRRAVEDLEKVVVVHEAKEGEGREIERRLVWRGAPNRRCHRKEVVVPERVRVPLSPQVRADALLAVAFSEERDRSGVEAEDVEDHAPLAGVDEVPPLGKEGAEGGAGPFVESSIAGDGEGHFRGDDGDVEEVEEAEEVGVGDCVEAASGEELAGSWRSWAEDEHDEAAAIGWRGCQLLPSLHSA